MIRDIRVIRVIRVIQAQREGVTEGRELSRGEIEVAGFAEGSLQSGRFNEISE